MKIPSRLHKSNTKLIAASNALHTYLVKEVKPLKSKSFVKKVQKNAESYWLPTQVNR